ncbi:MAG: ParB-like protein [Xanthobacteraceae bacterium]
MAAKREPVVKPVPILSLKPTQLTVGIREVKEKRKLWREHKPKKRAEVLGRHMIPVVLGPGDQHYVIDHHHLARALHDEGVKDVLVSVVADLSMVDPRSFWNAMDGHRFVHPYDAKGVRQHYDKLPKSIVGLKDDPYRSLAGELRRAGGFAKDTTPFSEFLWADFLRLRIPRKIIETNFAKAMERALSFGRGKDAIYLPGWCGPSSDD